MKSLFTLLVTALIVFSFSLAGYAASTMTANHSSAQSQAAVTGKKMEPMKKTEPTGYTFSLTGKVVSINKADHTMFVKGQETQWLFDVSHVANLDKVKPGESVLIKYTKKNDRMIASSVTPNARMSMNEPPFGYDPYHGWNPHFSGYNPYTHH